VIGCVVNFVMVGCTVIAVANRYICLLCELASQAVSFSSILKIEILNFRWQTMADKSSSGSALMHEACRDRPSFCAATYDHR
jgi:hypothetical protein